MMMPSTIENVLGQRGFIPTDYSAEWQLIDRREGQGNQLWMWNEAVLGPPPSQSELDLAANPLISLIITPIETGAVVTGQVTNAGYQGLANWRCIDPDGIIYTESDTMTNGADNWEIEMGKLGTYTIAAWVTGYGYAEGELTIA